MWRDKERQESSDLMPRASTEALKTVPEPRRCLQALNDLDEIPMNVPKGIFFVSNYYIISAKKKENSSLCKCLLCMDAAWCPVCVCINR